MRKVVLIGLVLVFVWFIGEVSRDAGLSRQAPALTMHEMIDLKGQAIALDPRRLSADPDAASGINIYLQGNALNVEQKSNYTWVNLQAEVSGRNTTEQVVVILQPPSAAILSDECYRFYGRETTTTQAERTLTGANVTLPTLYAYTWEYSPRAEYYGCQAP